MASRHANPDPVQANETVDKLFSRRFPYFVKKIKNYATQNQFAAPG
jgi:hypothetical protein